MFILAVIFGTACSLTSKIMLSMQSEGLTGEMEAFSFPLFQTFSMFVGMLASLPMHWAVLKFKIPFPGYAHENAEGKYIAINGDEVEKPKEMGWHVYFALLIPSLFDLVATALAMFGLKHVDVSIYQMLRGGAIVFVALLKQFMLGDKLKKFMWVGVFWNVMSIVLVGITAMLAATYGSTGVPSTDDSSSHYAPAPPVTTDDSMTAPIDGHHGHHSHHSHDSQDQAMAYGSDPMLGDSETGGGNNALLGVTLILLGAMVQSLQYAFEEKVMSMDVGAPPLLLIGMEGFWGAIFCAFVLYPLAYNLPGDDHGCIENPYNTYAMIQNSYDIQVVFTVYFLSIFGYNILCALITYMLNSVWHAILDNFRPITVWSTDLFIYYCVTRDFGEQWSIFSYIQLAGMFVLFYGTAIYNAPNAGSIKLTGGLSSCFMDFTEEYLEVEEDGNTVDGQTTYGSPHYSTMSPFQSSPASRQTKTRDKQNGYGAIPTIEMSSLNKQQSFA